MKAKYIDVPGSLGDKQIYPFFNSWTPLTWHSHQFSNIVINFKSCDFLAPWALILYAQYALWLRDQRGNKVRFEFAEDSRALEYAMRVGFDKIFPGEYPAPKMQGGLGNVTLLTRIQESKEVAPFARSVMGLLEVGDSELEGAIQYSLVELLRNLVQHSRSPTGGLAMAQYYPKSDLVEIAVADCGIGVRQSLRGAYPEIGQNDQKALRLALFPHVSGTFKAGAYGSMSDNAGLGLFFIKEIASRAYGSFFIGSGGALIDIWGNSDGTPCKKYLWTRGDWPGTFAILQLRKNAIGEFESLLEHCRELSAEARKNPSELLLDFIDKVPKMDGIRVVAVSSFEEDVEAAAKIREKEILPALKKGEMVVWDFDGIRAATQSFVHACMYKILRDVPECRNLMSIACATNATREAIRSVAAYAKVDPKPARKKN